MGIVTEVCRLRRGGRSDQIPSGPATADLIERGISVRDVDTTPFREATAKVYDDLGYGKLRDILRAMAAE